MCILSVVFSSTDDSASGLINTAQSPGEWLDFRLSDSKYEVEDDRLA